MRSKDPYAGVTDPVEILEIMLRPRKLDPSVEYPPYPRSCAEVMSELDTRAIARLQQRILQLWRAEPDIAEGLLRALGAFRSEPLDEVLSSMIELEEYEPPLVFARATPEIRSLLLQTTPPDDTAPLDGYLRALAWAGGPEIEARFRSFRENPPEWSNLVHTAPADYTKSASWELTKTGERRDLFQKHAYGLQATREDSAPVRMGDLVDEECGWCNRRLSVLLDLDASVPEIAALLPDWRRLRIATCVSCCGPYGVLYSDVTRDGDCSWHARPLPEYFDREDEGDPFPLQGLVIGLPRDPLCAADEFLPVTFSQLGGHPCWIQREEFPVCPGCEQSIPFLAQIALEDLEEYGQGIYSMFLCEDCQITATVYQHT